MFRKKDSGSYRQLIDGVELNTLVHGEKTLMGQFRLAQGAKIPMHEHPHEQTGMMLSGRLRFDVGGEIFEAVSGDSWNIPGDVPHSAEAMEDSVVIEVFAPVREDYLP
jgi:quercetin dioxygenase-like cupin family protein